MTSPTDRRYGLTGNAAIKAPVQAAITTAITLSGTQTVDGVPLVTGDRCLVAGQADNTTNGIYDVDTGAWTRSADFDGPGDVVQGTLVEVNGGTANGGYIFKLTSANPVIIGTSAMTFAGAGFAPTLPLAVGQGGTGSATAATARTALGTGTAVQSQTDTAFTTAGTDTAFTLTPTPAITANTTNQRFRVKFNAASGATPTLAVSGQTAKNLKYYNSTGAKQAITSTQVPINWISDVEYDGTDWVVLNVPPPSLQSQTDTTFTTAGTDTAFTLTPTPAITANTTNQRFRVKFNAASGATPTLAVSGQTAKNLKYYNSTGAKQAITSTQVPINWISDVEYDGTDWVVLQPVPPSSPPSSSSVLRSYLAGLTLSTAGGSPTMSIAAGQAADSTNAALMSIAAFTKGTGAWAVGSGNGGKMSAAALAAGWYHFYLIQRVDTGVVDIGFDTSATAPTMPTNYTLFRRIGSMKNDGTNWLAFTQEGDEFLWSTIVSNINASNPGTAAVTRTLTVPTGIKVRAIINVGIQDDTSFGICFCFLSSLDESDQAVSASTGGIGIQHAVPAIAQVNLMTEIRTNTSAQIRSRFSASGANTILWINTRGWTDTRGRNA